MTVGIHQPNFLPWLGYFDKINKSDVFVILDDVQFSKGSVGNRNRIKNQQGNEMWITVPLKNKKGIFEPYNSIEIDCSKAWQNTILSSLKANYAKAPFYKDSVIWLEQHITAQSHSCLADLNASIIKSLSEIFGLKGKFYFSSELNINSDEKNDRILNICKHFNADVYLSGMGAKKYNNEELFSCNKISIEYQSFKHPTYSQLDGPFLSNLSVIDALCNVGFEGVTTLIKESQTVIAY